MNTNIALSDLASCGTRRIRAELFRRVHWLCCTVLHKHIMPRTVDFFNPPPISPISGVVPVYKNDQLKVCIYRHVTLIESTVRSIPIRSKYNQVVPVACDRGCLANQAI